MHSRNDRAPNNHQRKFTISVHALERFRERVDEEFRSRSDLDLGNLLDEKLRHPAQRHTVRDPRAPEEITELYAIETRRNGTFYVVVRHATAVTVLDPTMAQHNFQESWAQIMNVPFNTTSLRGVLNAIQSTPPKITRDELVRRGDLLPASPPGSGADLTTLEQAGLDYARALRRCREAEQLVDRTKTAAIEAEQLVDRTKTAAIEAETALQAARDACTIAMQTLTTLAEGPKDV